MVTGASGDCGSVVPRSVEELRPGFAVVTTQYPEMGEKSAMATLLTVDPVMGNVQVWNTIC